MCKNWRAIANDAKPSPDDDRDLEVMARDRQYAETLNLCANELDAALRACADALAPSPAEKELAAIKNLAKCLRLEHLLGGDDLANRSELIAALKTFEAIAALQIENARLRADALAPPEPQTKAWLLTERRKDGRIVNEAIALTNDAAREWVSDPNLEFGQARSALPLKVLPAPPRADALDAPRTKKCDCGRDLPTMCSGCIIEDYEAAALDAAPSTEPWCVEENRKNNTALEGCTGEGRPPCTATECMFGIESCRECGKPKAIGGKCGFVHHAPVAADGGAVSTSTCADCGAALNAGEAKCFTVCDACWAKVYPKPADGGAVSRPQHEKDEDTK